MQIQTRACSPHPEFRILGIKRHESDKARLENMASHALSSPNGPSTPQRCLQTVGRGEGSEVGAKLGRTLDLRLEELWRQHMGPVCLHAWHTEQER